MDIVKMEHVTKIYGSGDTRVWALDDVNLTVQKGESLAVVGASGSGRRDKQAELGEKAKIEENPPT